MLRAGVDPVAGAALKPMAVMDWCSPSPTPTLPISIAQPDTPTASPWLKVIVKGAPVVTTFEQT
jgi:hypothetical protein